MIVQHLLFPNHEICTEREMYFREEGDVYLNLSEHKITFLSSFSAVLFNTYFNSFSIGKWHKYTHINRVNLTLRLQGKFVVTLWREEGEFENNVKELIGEEIFESDEAEEFTMTFNSMHTVGVYYFSLSALADNSVYYGGYYGVESVVMPRDIKFGVSICHFKKEPYIMANMASIARFLKNNPSFADKLEVFISDNGQTLTESDAPYGFVHIFPNKNVGGAGGFTRCMIEIQKSNAAGNDITHAVLMDDDLTFDPEIFFRTHAFLSVLKPKYYNYYFSGLMNRLDHKNIQHENGALWNGGNFISLKANLDMNNFNCVLFNECVEESVEFAPWWYCAIPVSVTENNLPLPIFYREDDSEYGMRSAKGVISVGGICVWHEPFDSKFVQFVCYYHSRNLHLVNALHHPEYGKRRLLEYTLNEVRRELYCMRYKIADLYLRAAEDFMRGIDWLEKTDTVALHQEVMSSCYKMQDIDDIKEMPFIWGEYAARCNRPPLSKWKRGIWKYSMCGHLIKGVRDVWVPIAPGKVRTEMFTKAKRAYHFDQNTMRGFVTERSFKEYRRVMKRYGALKRLVNKKYKKVAREYRERIGEVTSNEFWIKYLGI